MTKTNEEMNHTTKKMVYILSLKSQYFFVYKNLQMSFTINNNIFCVDQILCRHFSSTLVWTRKRFQSDCGKLRCESG